MVEFLKILIIFWTIIIINFVFIKCEFCPQRCTCDLYKNQNRAVCSGWKLINAAIDIPKNVEYFDLSDNSITTLDNTCFEGLSHLLNLTINYNSIHTIYLDAFKQLVNIKYIDLSYNRLEYIDDRIFENNHKLVELNLSGNKFMSLQNKPIIGSKSIEILHLQNTQITHIYPQLFEWMPSIKTLDLSKNLMITLTISPFNKLRKLNIINLEGNRWICDKNIVNVVTLLRRRNVIVNMNDDCKKEINSLASDNTISGSVNRNGPKMFERMIMEAPRLENSADSIPDIKKVTTERVHTNVRTIWKNFNTIDDDNNNCIDDELENVCKLYENCMLRNDQRFGLLKNYTNNDNQTTHGQVTHNFIGNVQASFFIGMSVGAALVFVLVACTICAAKCCKGKRRRKRCEVNRSVSTDEFEYIAPSPSPCRLARRPIVRSAHPLTLNRSLSTPARRSLTTNQGDFATFVTRLFERPSRHRYYRAINQNTAHLVRRLSRSNLLNNRLSRHFLDETNRNNTTVTIQNNRNDLDENHGLMNISTDPIQTSERAETPPPAYIDVAMIKY